MEIYVSFILAAILVIVLSKFIFKGTKTIMGILINILVGAAALWVLNLIGIGIALTWLTAAIVGFLGLPGVILILIVQFLL